MIRHIIKEEGISAFFKGVIPSIIMTINPVIQYIIYEYLKIKFLHTDGTLSSGNILWISVLSKFITTLVTYPMLTIKTLFQSNEKSTSDIIKIIEDLIKTKGLKGLFDGISAKLAQTLINNAITMLTYEKLQNLLKILAVILLSSRVNSNSNAK